MFIFLTALFTVLAFTQYVVFSRRISKIEKTWDDVVVLATAFVLAWLITSQFGPLLVSHSTGNPLDWRMVVPIFANLFAGIGYSLMPRTILNAEQRVTFSELPGLPTERLAIIAGLLSLAGLAAAIFLT